MRKSPTQGKLVVKRLSAHVKASKQAAKAVRPTRQATVALRYLKVGLPTKRKAPVEVIHVREKAPPPGAKRLEWFLLTTLPVENAGDAERTLTWYGLRWRRLFPDPEVRLPNRGSPEPDGRTPSACRRHQHGHRLAYP